MNPFFAAAGITVTGPFGGDKILDSTLAGSWFESNPQVLRAQIKEWMNHAEIKSGMAEHPIAILQPHAGYQYSGQTAAYGAKALAGKKYDKVIILGPTHRLPMRNLICVPDAATAMRSPLGTVKIDRDALKELKQSPMVKTEDSVLLQEHSVQIQLPFLQAVFGDGFRVIPVVVGQLDDTSAEKAAALLRKITDPSTLVVVSSDFTHYGRNFDYVPFRKDIEENLRKLDLGAFETIRSGRMSEFGTYLQNTGATICGEGPIRILLAMLPPHSRIELLHYTTSSAESRDFSHCVSYVSGVVNGNWASAGTTEKKPEKQEFLSAEEKKTLLSMARRSIEYVFEHHRATPETLFQSEAVGNMKKKAGCFVTLKLGGELRGCIGEIEPVRPLYQAVTGRAVDAAFRDSRFPQLSPAELKRIEIEISALTPEQTVESYRDIVIGKHGMTIAKDGRSAVFLPQVAPEQGWDLPTTLTFLSRKAGLAGDAWKSPEAKFTVFEAVVFHENKE